MDCLILICHNRGGLSTASRIQQPINSPFWIRIEHKDLPKMRVSMPEQFESVFFRSSKCLLVTMYDTIVVIFDISERDEAISNQVLAPVRRSELLRVPINAGFGIARQNSVLNPDV